jgi:transposase
MNYRKIANKDNIILAIQNALSDSEKAKFYHRLDLVMLAVNGMPVKEIAALFNESPTTISFWTKKVVELGVDALKSGEHTGRKPRLLCEQLRQLDEDLQKAPSEFGYDFNLWDGLVLCRHLSDHYAVNIQVRQCQRILRQLGYTLQRPQTKPYGSNPEAQEEFKKN